MQKIELRGFNIGRCELCEVAVDGSDPHRSPALASQSRGRGHDARTDPTRSVGVVSVTAINASIWTVKAVELPKVMTEEASVAQLIVRDLSEDLVKALKQRAAKRNRSTEQEHREILQSVLRGPKRRHLGDVLAAIPNVGEDSDFRRAQTDQRG
jgi:plasmid stability protein